MDQPKWLDEAWRELGQRERTGAADNARILAMYREAGHASVAHDEVPWCAAFVGACLSRAGMRGTRSLMARSYASYGEQLSEPRTGAIAVLSRGRDPALGHVGFVVGALDDQLFLLGGNQGDAVSVAAFPLARLVALRWPDKTAGSLEQGPAPSSSASSLFEAAIAHVLEMEGGYTDDPYDPGGPTNKGILLRELAEWQGVSLDAFNTARLKGELRMISDETVRAIYQARYWRPAGCEALPPALAFIHFDAAVNQGVGTAIRMLQHAVGADADGEIGPLTRAAIMQTPVTKAIANYADIRRRRYRALKHFWRFGRGWLKRVDTTLTRAMALAGEAAPTPRTSSKGVDDMAKEAGKQEQAKWWGQSMTIWGVLVTAASTVIPALAPVIGLELPGELVQDAGGKVADTLQALGGLLGTLMAIAGRLRASQPLQRRALSIRL
jgi:uncharacterized protein (TIGR02594 family)